ncbi:MAG TPA: hypothetical protein VH703_07335 [Solirubrobacterales bacterium]|jgi:hypothetical protein
MSRSYEELWAAVPDKAMHATRVAIVEALWWIGEPISAIRLVDVFDGQLGSQWETLHHLRVLRRLGVLRAVPGTREKGMMRGNERCYVLYRLSRCSDDE